MFLWFRLLPLRQGWQKSRGGRRAGVAGVVDVDVD